jgi:hypothetical protein
VCAGSRREEPAFDSRKKHEYGDTGFASGFFTAKQKRGVTFITPRHLAIENVYRANER